MDTLILILLALASLRSGLGTVFHANGDSGNPNPGLACVPFKDPAFAPGDARRYRHRRLDDRMLVVALPVAYPCGALVWIYCPRTGRSAIAVVADRGPRHALIDMSRAVARRLRHNGHERVVIALIPPRRGRR